MFLIHINKKETKDKKQITRKESKENKFPNKGRRKKGQLYPSKIEKNKAHDKFWLKYLKK